MRSTKLKELFKKDKKQIDLIKDECEKYGLKIYDVFRDAKVPVVTIANWVRKEPDAFDTLKKVYDSIERLRKQK